MIVKQHEKHRDRINSPSLDLNKLKIGLLTGEKCSLLGIGESNCTQKIGDFPLANNGKSKNESLSAQ